MKIRTINGLRFLKAREVDIGVIGVRDAFKVEGRIGVRNQNKVNGLKFLKAREVDIGVIGVRDELKAVGRIEIRNQNKG